MTQVSVEKVKKLLEEVEEKVNLVLAKEGKENLKQLSASLRSHEITRVINTLTGSSLLASTYQVTYIYGLPKIKKEIGCSQKYLEAFSKFLSLDIPSRLENLNSNEAINNRKIIFPSRPEFPLNNPAFPASPHYQISIPGFKCVWIKDESYNTTGTHKDRKAYELLTYLQHKHAQSLITDSVKGIYRPLAYPPIVLISNGNEAYAIQSLFSSHGHTDISVIVDVKLKGTERARQLEEINCKVFFRDLTIELNSEQVKEITGKSNAIDLTTHLNEDLKVKRHKYYDWLSYEILNLSPQYCFVPAGTGDLFINLLEFNDHEICQSKNNKPHDKRYFGHLEHLTKCEFLGASTKNPNSKADKLFTSFNSTFEDIFQNQIKEFVTKGSCGKITGIYEIDEEYLELAFQYSNALGINAEYSGISGLALFFSMMSEIPKEKTIVIVNTGKLKLHNEIGKEEKIIKPIIEKVIHLNRKHRSKP